MTDPHTPVSALGRAYMSGYADGERDTIGRRPAPQYTLGVPPAPLSTQRDIALREDLNEWRRRAETAETALAEVRGQRDYAVTSLANMVDAVVKAPRQDGTDAEWIAFAPALDTDGEPMLVADGTLTGSIRLSGNTTTAGGGFELRIRFEPGQRTRIGTGYAYRIKLPFGPDGTPPEVIGND
jgi:hypothetical protein